MLILYAFGCDDTEFPSRGGGTIVGDDYASVVQVFDGSCVGCHGPNNPPGGLDLETDPCSAIVDVPSSQSVPYVVPGDPEGSLLWSRIADNGTHGSVMPPSGKMPQANIDTVAAWIEGGAICDEPVASLEQNVRAGGGW